MKNDTKVLPQETGPWSCYTTSPQRSLEIFEEARAQCPVAHSREHNGFYLLLNYEDVKRAMADHKTFSSVPQVLRPMLPRKPIPALEMDPPQHGPWRSIFNNAITPRTTGAMENFVRADVNHHINQFIARGSCDLVHDRDELKAEPKKLLTVVEGVLRLRPPFFGFFRRATKDIEVSGVEIPAECDVYMGWAAANRDPKAFTTPDDLKIDRYPNRHLTFGFGIHTCPGASLARMELRVLLEELLRRIPDLSISTVPEWARAIKARNSGDGEEAARLSVRVH